MHVLANQVVMAVGSTTGISSWLKSNVVPLVILVIGLAIMMMARRKDHSGAIVTVGILLVGLMVVGMAIGDTGINVGAWLSNLVFG